MYTVYILASVLYDRYYTGHCKDITIRLKRHNAGYVRSTKAYIPWKVVYTEQCNTKSQAYKREMQIKTYKGGSAFQKLIEKVKKE